MVLKETDSSQSHRFWLHSVSFLARISLGPGPKQPPQKHLVRTPGSWWYRVTELDSSAISPLVGIQRWELRPHSEYMDGVFPDSQPLAQVQKNREGSNMALPNSRIRRIVALTQWEKGNRIQISYLSIQHYEEFIRKDSRTNLVTCQLPSKSNREEWVTGSATIGSSKVSTTLGTIFFYELLFF